MAGLISELFKGDHRLEACLVDHGAHVTAGARGDHVAKLQYALLVLEPGKISGKELEQKRYGPDTARLVLAYKARRKIINFSYQSKPDDIIGKMTMRSLDTEMVAFEARERFHAMKPKPLARLRS